MADRHRRNPHMKRFAMGGFEVMVAW